MSHYLQEYVSNRDNNFNLIRFVAASMVLIHHSYHLLIGRSIITQLKHSFNMDLGTIAVDIFFIVSGFLVTKSLITRNNLGAFIWARFLRIYPALAVAVAFCVFGIGLFFTTLPMSSYLTNFNVYKYFIKNTVLFLGIDYNLPGVFENLPYKSSINGSLWTLPWELGMYAILAVLGGSLLYFQNRCRKIYLNYVFVIIGVTVIIGNFINYLLINAPFHAINIALRLSSMFFMGSAYYMLRNRILLSNGLFAITIMILMIALLNSISLFIFYNCFIAYIVLYLAYIPSGNIRKFNNVGDYSYGMYIYAFPIQQSIISIIDGISMILLFLLSFIFTLILSIFSWHYVEKRFLRMKDNLLGFRLTLK